MFAHDILGRYGREELKRMKVGESFFINIYENYGVGTMRHDTREEAEQFVRDGPIPAIYRIRIIKK